MNYGIVDLGSNSIRLSIYEVQDGQPRLLINKKEMAGLAGYVSGGILEETGIERACAALESFHEILGHFGIKEMHAFATASLRNIENRSEAVAEIARRTGVKLVVLSGSQEAHLDFVGAAHTLSLDEGMLVDIGGGSTELVHFRQRQIVHLVSLPIGSLSLHKAYVEGLLPTPNERKEIKKAIRREFDALDWKDAGRCDLLCGVGGTVRAALKISRELFGVTKGETAFPAGNVSQIVHRLRSRDEAEQAAVYRIVPERTPSLLPGMMILKEAVRRFGCQTVEVSSSGVREGYLLERVLGAQG